MTPFDVLGVHCEVMMDASECKGRGDFEVDWLVTGVEIGAE